MGPALVKRVPDLAQVAGYATEAPVCPHAAKAKEAARMAEAFSTMHKQAIAKSADAEGIVKPQGKCPFPHGAAMGVPPPHPSAIKSDAVYTADAAAAKNNKFSYEGFYSEELDKKHKGERLSWAVRFGDHRSDISGNAVPR